MLRAGIPGFAWLRAKNKPKNNFALTRGGGETPPKSTKTPPKKLAMRPSLRVRPFQFLKLHKNTKKHEKNTHVFFALKSLKKHFRAHARKKNHFPGLAQISQKRRNSRSGFADSRPLWFAYWEPRFIIVRSPSRAWPRRLRASGRASACAGAGGGREIETTTREVTSRASRVSRAVTSRASGRQRRAIARVVSRRRQLAIRRRRSLLRFFGVANGVCRWRRRSLRFVRQMTASLIASPLLRCKRHVPVAPSVPSLRSPHDDVAHCLASPASQIMRSCCAVSPFASLVT